MSTMPIRSHDVSISLDDFGIEPSALCVLRELPFDTVRTTAALFRRSAAARGLTCDRSDRQPGPIHGQVGGGHDVENGNRSLRCCSWAICEPSGCAFGRPVPAEGIAVQLELWLATMR